jgi:cyclopropane fatty-acyl-phospholipid synthase-like methyltransferase
MTKRKATLDPGYFEAIYAATNDPWSFASSAYEREKYALTLSALPKSRYQMGLEIGCSIGVLTCQLSARCQSLLAIDAAESPLADARRRCADVEHIRFERMFVPTQWPGGSFDLVLLSEMIYYLDASDVANLAKRVRSSLTPESDVVLVHWIGETDYPLTGDEATDLFVANLEGAARIVHQDRRRDFRLDVLSARRDCLNEMG